VRSSEASSIAVNTTILSYFEENQHLADSGEQHDQEPDDATDTRTKLLREVAAQTEAIEADFGDDFGIVAAVSVVLVRRPDGNTGFRVRPIDIDPLSAIGVLSMAQDVLKAQVGGAGPAAEPDNE
jgi:hypothetical protein